MGFDVPDGDWATDAYGQFMGRFSEPLAREFVGVLDLQDGHRVLDVGCGPGALTAELVRRLGPDAVSAADPAAPFVQAVRSRLPGVDVRLAGAEHLPFPDNQFDRSAAQLVVHFMTDPVAGLTEMARVTAAGGVVAACVWDHGGGAGPLSVFWQAVRAVDPAARDESGLPGATEGQLPALFRQAGLFDVRARTLTVTVDHQSFEQWWHPYTLGVGPAGAFVRGLDERRRAELRDHCRSLLPPAPFEITAAAWTAIGRVGPT